jgi:heavy metal sensor kinase
MTHWMSLRWRITLWFGGSMAVILLGGGTMTYLLLRHQLFERIDGGLHEELADVLGEVQKGNDRETMLGWLDRRFGRHEGFDFQITDSAGKRVFANQRLGERRLPVPAGSASETEEVFETFSVDQHGRYRTVTRHASGPDGPLLVQVARSLDVVDHELMELLAALAIAGSVAMIVTAGGGYLLSRRVLAPVDRMTVAANEIDARQFGRRLEVVNRDDELGRLGQTLNRMLDRLERSFLEMQRFTADASHELRTPISVIRAEAEIALGKPLPETDKQELLSNILEECQRLTWITDQLLALCREDAGVTQSNFEPVDLAQLVREVSETMRPLAEAKDQKLGACANSHLLVRGDPVRLRHVVYNLVDNAIKYTPAGGAVNVSVTAVDHHVRLVVQDTGIGIADEHLPRVFERFYRVDKSRSRVAGGAGLGLSIVQSIVSAHGGTVEITSRVGAGTRCAITMPIAVVGRPSSLDSH